MKLGTVAVDTAKSEDGIWREVVRGTGFECRIARHNNSRFRAALESRIIDLSRDSQKEPTAEQYAEATLMAFCSCVLVDWRGLEDDDDKPIDYSPEKAFEILSDPQYADLRESIESISQDQKAYRRVENEGN